MNDTLSQAYHETKIVTKLVKRRGTTITTLQRIASQRIASEHVW